jgi:hypothetical protein
MFDTTPPTLTGLTFPWTVDLNSKSKSVTFCVAATGDASSISYSLISIRDTPLRQPERAGEHFLSVLG